MMASEIVQDRDRRPAEEGSSVHLGVTAPAGIAVPGDSWRQELAGELIGRARSEGCC
jgi:hypothetical protein